MVEPVARVHRKAWRSGQIVDGERAIPEETAVAFTYNGSSYAVMMATPQNLGDFALGFSLTERIVEKPGDIESVDIIDEAIGIEVQMRLREPLATAFADRRRFLAGPTGCGLCGIESLTEAMRPLAKLEDGTIFTADEISEALAALPGLQAINQATRAVHAAAFWRGSTLVALREDVGRHNALDKLVGALAAKGLDGRGGLAILTSRLSVELVQKAAVARIPVLVAVSAPTALAVRTAEAAGITLIGVARGDGFEIFTHAERVTQDKAAHVRA